MVRLLEVLTRPNVGVQSVAVPGGNTSSAMTISVDTWYPWINFNYTTLTRIFRRELASEYRGSQERVPLDDDTNICSEDTLEDLLRGFITPAVNYALNGQVGSCYFGRGSRCSIYIKSDWSVTSPDWINNDGGYINILPGDTKLSSKWQPTMIDGTARQYAEWKKVMAQVVGYMVSHESRYGFVITDACLVVLRVTRRESTSDITTISDVSMVSSSSDDSSQDRPLQWEYHPPEYAIVPWSAHGPGNLTIKLSLWFLAMMAANGDRFLDFSYPDLDTWRGGEKGYTHNTSGATLSKLSKDQRYEDRDPHRRDGSRGAAGMAGPSGARTAMTSGGYNADNTEGAEYQTSSFISSGDVRADSNRSDEEENDKDQEQLSGLAAGERIEEGAEEIDSGSSVQTKAPARKRINVDIKKHRHSGGLYFLDNKGHKRETARRLWERVDGGHELRGEKHIYFTQHFP